MENELNEILNRIAEQKGFKVPKKPKATTTQELIDLSVKWYNEAQGDLNEKDNYNCDICKNKGDIAKISENGMEVHKICKCMKYRNLLRKAKMSGIGDAVFDFKFENYTTNEEWQKIAKKKAQDFCTDITAGFFFIGGAVGSGKSHLCTAIVGYYLKTDKTVRYMTWAEESKILKAVANEKIYYSEIKPYKKVDVLYIDDFLKTKQGEQPTNADINLAFEIINSRMLDKSKITIISSEKTINELLTYDEATASRIYKKAGTYKIDIPKGKNTNYRLKRGENNA